MNGKHEGDSRREPGTSVAAQTDAEESLGTVVSDLTNDLSTLMRLELALARAELRTEAKKAGKAAGLLGGAGLAGWMVALFASITIMWALDRAMAVVWAALIVTALWLVVGLILFISGRQQLRQVSPVPDQTAQSLKEEKEWIANRKS